MLTIGVLAGTPAPPLASGNLAMLVTPTSVLGMVLLLGGLTTLALAARYRPGRNARRADRDARGRGAPASAAHRRIGVAEPSHQATASGPAAASSPAAAGPRPQAVIMAGPGSRASTAATPEPDAVYHPADAPVPPRPHPGTPFVGRARVPMSR